MRRLMQGVASLGMVVAAMADVGAQEGGSPDWPAIARHVVSRMSLQKGERVLLVGVPGAADEVVAPLRAAVVGAGGVDLGALAAEGGTPPGWTSAYVTAAAGKSLEELTAYFRDVEVAVILPGATPAFHS